MIGVLGSGGPALEVAAGVGGVDVHVLLVGQLLDRLDDAVGDLPGGHVVAGAALVLEKSSGSPKIVFTRLPFCRHGAGKGVPRAGRRPC